MAIEYKNKAQRKKSIVTTHLTEDMVKTTPRHCSTCEHEWGKYGDSVMCGYYIDTGKHRGCPQGYCNKKTPKTGKLRNNNIRYSIKMPWIRKERGDFDGETTPN